MQKLSLIPISKTVPSIFKLFGDLIENEEFLQYNLKNLKFLAENESHWIRKKPFFAGVIVGFLIIIGSAHKKRKSVSLK